MISILTFTPNAGLPEIRMSPPMGLVGQTASSTSGPSFGTVLQDYADSAVSHLKQGEAAAVAGIEGKLPVQSVVEQIMAAERTLQAAIAVRDKLVGSYLEITRMQV